MFKINRFWQPSQSDVRSFQYHEIENFNLVIKINREIDFGKRLIFFNRGCLGWSRPRTPTRTRTRSQTVPTVPVPWNPLKVDLELELELELSNGGGGMG